MSGALTRASSASWSVSICLALPLGLDPAQVVVDLVVGAGLVPAELAGHQLGRGPGRGDAAVEGLDRDAGTPGEHVVEVPRALVGDGVDDLGGQVVLGAGQRLGQLGPARRSARAPRRPGRRSGRAGGRCGRRAARTGGRAATRWLVRASKPSAPTSGTRSVMQSRGIGHDRRRRRRPGHHPVRRELAAGDHHQAGHGRTTVCSPEIREVGSRAPVTRGRRPA